MNTLTWNQFLSGELRDIPPASATIGVFDGVHTGHQYLIEKAVKTSETVPVLFTFSGSPLSVLGRRSFSEYIMPPEERIAYFEKGGIEKTVLIDFSPDFSKLSGTDFFSSILENISLLNLYIGKNFRCGYQADMSSDDIRNYLEQHGVHVHIADPVTFEGEPVSSTRIRETIKAGDIERANSMLGRMYSLRIPKTGENEDNELTEAYIEKKHFSQVIPGEGSYRIIIGDGDNHTESILRIGKDRLTWTQPKQFTTETMQFIAYTK